MTWQTPPKFELSGRERDTKFGSSPNKPSHRPNHEKNSPVALLPHPTSPPTQPNRAAPPPSSPSSTSPLGLAASSPTRSGPGSQRTGASRRGPLLHPSKLAARPAGRRGRPPSPATAVFTVRRQGSLDPATEASISRLVARIGAGDEGDGGPRRGSAGTAPTASAPRHGREATRRTPSTSADSPRPRAELMSAGLLVPPTVSAACQRLPFRAHVADHPTNKLLLGLAVSEGNQEEEAFSCGQHHRQHHGGTQDNKENRTTVAAPSSSSPCVLWGSFLPLSVIFISKPSVVLRPQICVRLELLSWIYLVVDVLASAK